MSATQPRKSNKSRKSPPPKTTQPAHSVLDELGSFWLRLERYRWDVLGVLLIAVSALTALALFGLTQGSFISPGAVS